MAAQCPVTAPVVLAGTAVCTSKSGSNGAFGFWLKSGTYVYMVNAPGASYGPYPLTVGGSGGGGGSYVYAPPLTDNGVTIGVTTSGTGGEVVTTAAPGVAGNFPAWTATGDIGDSGTNAAAIEAVIASTYAPLASPTFTGTLTAPTVNASNASLGSLTVTSCTGCTTVPNYVFTPPLTTTGTTIGLPTTGTGPSAVSAVSQGLSGNFASWTATGDLGDSGTNQTAINAAIAAIYAPLASPTFTGTATIPAFTSTTGNITALTVGSCTGCGGGSGSGPLLETNGFNNTNQALLNLAGLNGNVLSNVGGTTFIVAHPYLTVATLPSAASNASQIYNVGDAATNNSCTTGGGGYIVTCKSNGAAWIYQPGAGGSALATASSPGIVQPDNTTITINGSGVITSLGGGSGGSSTTVNAATGFGAIGDGAWYPLGASSTLAAGATSITSSSVSAHPPPVGGILIIYQAGNLGNGAWATGSNIITTVTAVSGSTLTWATPTITAVSANVNMYWGHDNTTALTNWAAACSTTPQAKCYIPGGVYLNQGGIHIYGSNEIYGDGRAATILKTVAPANDMLVLRGVSGGHTLVPGAWIPGPSLHDMGFAGTAMETTGSLLLLDIAEMGQLDSLMWYGHGGPGLNLYSGERTKMTNLWFSSVKRSIIDSEITMNESNIDMFDIQSDGCVGDNLGPGGYYNTNVNSVNGVYPSSGTLIEDHHAAVTLYSVADFTMKNGSIKPAICHGGIQVTDSTHTSSFDHIYYENAAGQWTFFYSFIFGGPWEETPTATELTTGSIGGDLVDGSYMPDQIGNAGDATTPAYFAILRPPDFVSGNTTTLSSICPSGSACATGPTPIYQGTLEYVGFTYILHDTVGSGWHPHWQVRHQSGSTYSTSVDWPAGAIFDKTYNALSGGPVSVASSNFNFAGTGYNSNYTQSCNVNNGTPCGEIGVGIWPGVLNVPGSAQFVPNGRTILIEGVNKLAVNNNNLAAGTIDIANNGSVIAINTPNAGGQSYAVNATSATDNTIIPMFFTSSTAQIRREVWANGNGPNFTFKDATRHLQLYGGASSTSYPIGVVNILGDAIGSGMSGYADQFPMGRLFEDSKQCNTGTSYCDTWTWLGADTVPNQQGPGFRVKTYNGSSLQTTFRQYYTNEALVTEANYPVGIVEGMNLGDTKPTAGMTLNNAVSLMRVKTSTVAPTVVPQGSTGTRTVSYCVVAYESDGTHTACSPVGTTTTATVPPYSATNYNKITWSGFLGYPAYFNVFCTAGCTTQGQVNTLPIPGTIATYNDVTGAGTGSAPTSNNTGSLYLGDTNIGGSVAADTATGLFTAAGPVNTINIFDDGGLASVPTGTQTPCTVANRGEFWILFNAVTVADALQICGHNTTGVYQWMTVGTGSSGTPGGATNSIQFNGGGSFAGLLNSTSTREYLTETNSAAPVLGPILAGDLPVATASAFGAVKPDGTTITIAGGVLTSLGGAGGTETVSINGGTAVAPVSGNVNLTIPPLIPAANSGLSFTTTGGNVVGSTVSAMDIQPAGTGYTVPAADCTGTGGTFLLNGGSGTTTTIGVAQAGVGGNWLAGCSLDIYNASTTSTLTVALATSTYNGGATPTIAAASGTTYHHLHLISTGTNYIGYYQ